MADILSQRNDVVVGNLAVTGSLVVSGDVVGEFTGEVTGNAATATLADEATAVTGLTFPVELTEAGVTAAQIWTALNTAGILVEPA